MPSAFATDGTSRATISRSRASIATSCSLCHELRHLRETFKLRAKEIGNAGIGNIVHIVKCCVGARDRQLLRYDKRAAAEFENLTQCHQRAQATGATWRRRSNREHTPLEGSISWIASLSHARHPVDSILQNWRYRCAVVGAGDENALVRHDHLLELQRVGGLPSARVE